MAVVDKEVLLGSLGEGSISRAVHGSRPEHAHVVGASSHSDVLDGVSYVHAARYGNRFRDTRPLEPFGVPHEVIGGGVAGGFLGNL